MNELLAIYAPLHDPKVMLKSLSAARGFWQGCSNICCQNLLLAQARGHSGEVLLAHDPESGLVLLLEGHLYGYGPDPVGGQPARHLSAQDCLEAFKAHGLDFLHKIQGDFNLIIHNRSANELIVANDRFGLRPLFYGKYGRNFVISSDLPSVVASGVIPYGINQAQLISFLCFTKLRLGRDTVYENVCALPPASILRWREGELSIVPYWHDMANASREKLDNVVELGREAARLYRQGVRLRMSTGRKFVLALSGGLDSRSIAASVAQEDLERITSYSWGIPNNTEAKIARQVAETVGFRNVFIPMGPNDFIAVASELFEYLGEPDLFIQAPMMSVSREMARENQTLMTGLSLGTTLGGYFLSDEVLALESDEAGITHIMAQRRIFSPEIFQPQMRKRLLPEVEQMLRDTYMQSRQESCPTRYDDFVMTAHHNRVLFMRDRLYRKNIDMTFPTFDYAFMELARSVPPNGKRLHRLFPSFLSALNPELAELPYNKTGLPARVPARFWPKGAQLEFQKERLLRDIWVESRGKVFVPYTGYYTNFDEWFRLNRNMMRFVDKVLLDEKTLCCQSYLERDVVRRMVSDHRSGAANYYKEILYLVSFELFLRYLDRLQK